MSEQKKSIMTPSTSVLIVDDNQQFSTLLRMILGQGFGYKDITLVDSTTKAFDLITADPNRYQLMFVDYNFPEGETGGELLQKLKSGSLMGDKVAFLITSEPTVDNQKQALNAGAKGVVAKPFDRESIRSQIEKAERAIKADNSDNF